LQKRGVVPYGFAYLEGKLVVDPREYKVVLSMVRLWQCGKSFKAIASHLNAKKIPTRLGRRWFGPTVAAIVRRELEKNPMTKQKENSCLS